MRSCDLYKRSVRSSSTLVDCYSVRMQLRTKDNANHTAYFYGELIRCGASVDRGDGKFVRNMLRF